MSSSSKQCAFLSTHDLDDFFVYDYMLCEPLAMRGWQVEEVSWRDETVDWDHYDLVVIRSTWDYQSMPQAFMACLEKIEASRAVLENSLSLIKWNISKAYLRDLQSAGVPIVPSQWFERFDYEAVMHSLEAMDGDEAVIKPLVSANADHTYRLDKASLSAKRTELQATFADRAFILQPFVSSIVDEGEYSLFYFGGEYSHCILKVPKADDFRVQEEHGGQLRTVQPDATLLALGAQTLAATPGSPLYARLDFVRGNNGFMVMEIELIEPSLYFNMDPENSPTRFVDALTQRYGSNYRVLE